MRAVSARASGRALSPIDFIAFTSQRQEIAGVEKFLSLKVLGLIGPKAELITKQGLIRRIAIANHSQYR
jgi:hypothetical protein